MNPTKKSFLTSIVALVLCLTMFLGTTFAWFTDIVVSGGNIIQSGKLDAEMYWSDEYLASTDSGWTQVKDNKPIFTYDNWEPGYTEIKYIKVANAGNLNFKWKLSIEAEGKVTDLSDVIDVYYVNPVNGELTKQALAARTPDGKLTDVLANKTATEGDQLTPGGSVVLAIAFHMDELAGNEYQEKSLCDKGFSLKLLATQATGENDSFDDQYDKESEWPENTIIGNTASAPAENVNGLLGTAASMTSADGKISANVPAGTKLDAGASKLTLNVANMDKSKANITLDENEAALSIDVHILGVAKDNEIVMEISVKELLPVGLNMGNYRFYHVENGNTVEMTLLADGATPVHNNYEYDPATGDVVLYLKSFSEVALVAEPAKWEGNRDYSWYTNAVAPVDGEAVTEYIIANADQLAGFSAIVGGMVGQTQDSFAGKTVKLIADIDLNDAEKENKNHIFYPIGYWNNEGTYERKPLEERTTAVSSGFYTFEGTFDGNGHTIANFYQNTWEMKGDHNWYDPIKEQYYRDGMGLFGRVYKGTVKNLTVKNFSSDGEIATTGVIAAYADGATFENIAIFNCNPRVYNIGNGGIVGCVGWYAKEANLKTTFTNITVDNSNKISALWGSYDVACGGIVGQYYPTSGQSSATYPVNAGIDFVNCHVSAIMDVYNDVCANYQYYAYRYTGMLIGSVRENVTIDGHSYPKMDGITAKDCTVHFGTWNDYYYCEIIDNTTASYTHDYQMSRLTEIKAIDGTTITYLDGTTGTVPASGRANYVIVDYTKGHGTENATCYHFKDGAVWTHDMGGIQTGIDENGDGQDDLREDKQHIYLEFNNLVTGYGWGVTSKWVGELDGVKILDRAEGNSVNKFAGKEYDLSGIKAGDSVTIDKLFAFIENSGVAVKPETLVVSVTDLTKTGITADFTRGDTWDKGTLKFNGTNGIVRITIQDYYFCNPTSITVEIGDFNTTNRFDVKFPNTSKYLYRLGNLNHINMSSLFGLVNGVDTSDIGNVDVVVTDMSDNKLDVYTAGSGAWDSGSIDFDDSFTGPAKITISDDNFSTPVTLIVEVVIANNYTSKPDVTAHNAVLLNDVSGSFTVYNGYSLYGNGFTVALPTSYQASFTAGYVGYITINNGNLDNVRIEGPVYPVMNIYQSQAQNTTTNKEEYFYNSILINGGNCTISNSYISGSRTAICIRGGNNVIIDNTTLAGGSVANMEIAGANTVTLRDLTTVQIDKTDSYGQNKTSHGMGIYVSNGICKIHIEGELNQRNWVNQTQWTNLVGDYVSFFPRFFTDSTYANYQKKIDGVTYVNLAMVFACNWERAKLDVTNQTNKDIYLIKDGISLQGYTGGVYSITGQQPTSDDLAEIIYQSSGFSPIAPKFDFDNSTNHDIDDENDSADTYCEYSRDTGILSIGVTGSTKTIDLSGISIKKDGVSLDYTAFLNGVKINGNSITISSANGTKQTIVIRVVTTEAGYDSYGNPIVGEIIYEYTINIDVATLAYPGPVWKIDGYISGTTTYQFDTTNCYYVYYQTSQGYGEAVPIYDGIKISYYDKNGNLKEEDLSNTQFEPKGKGEAISLNTAFTYTLGDGSILTMTVTGSYKSGVSSLYCTNYNGKTYVYPSALDTDSNVRPKKNSYDFNVSIKYTFTDPNGLSTEEITINWYGAKANGSKIKDAQWKDFDGDNGKKYESPCVTPDTLVTLANGTQKRIDEVTYNDQLLVWNHFTGKYDVAPAAIIFNHGYDNNTIIKLSFSDGTVVKVANLHQFYDIDLNRYVSIDADSVAQYVGHSFAKQSGDGFTTVTLDSYEISVEYEAAYGIISALHYNIIVEGMISTDFMLEDYDLFNYFELGENMTFDEAQMQADIEKYGLYTYEDFADYLTYEQFVGFNVQYFKIAVGKGNYTYEGILELINTYLNK